MDDDPLLGSATAVHHRREQSHVNGGFMLGAGAIDSDEEENGGQPQQLPAQSQQVGMMQPLVAPFMQQQHRRYTNPVAVNRFVDKFV